MVAHFLIFNLTTVNTLDLWVKKAEKFEQDGLFLYKNHFIKNCSIHHQTPLLLLAVATELFLKALLIDTGLAKNKKEPKRYSHTIIPVVKCFTEYANKTKDTDYLLIANSLNEYTDELKIIESWLEVGGVRYLRKDAPFLVSGEHIFEYMEEVFEKIKNKVDREKSIQSFI